jgi:hypothetical protein
MRSIAPGGLAIFVLGCGGGGGNPDAEPPGPPDAAGPMFGDPTIGRWLDDYTVPGASGFGARVEDVELLANGDVVIAGIFEDVGGVTARNVALWNGTDWQRMDTGLDGWVRALAIDAGAGRCGRRRAPSRSIAGTSRAGTAPRGRRRRRSTARSATWSRSATTSRWSETSRAACACTTPRRCSGRT